MNTMFLKLVIVHGWFSQRAQENKNNIESYLSANPDKFELIYDVPALAVYKYIGANPTDSVQHFSIDGHRVVRFTQLER